MSIIDIINTIFQSVVFTAGVSFSINNDEKENKIKMFILSILFFIDGILFTNILGNISLCIFVTHIIAILFIAVLFKKNMRKGIVGYSTIYIAIGLFGVVFNNTFYLASYLLKHNNYFGVYKLLCASIAQFIFFALIIIKKNKVKELFNIIFNKIQNCILVVAISFILDFIMISNIVIFTNESILFKNISVTIIYLGLSLFALYFAKIKQKANEIFKLNLALDAKNKELRKIKHDYGAQISYLYGLYLMERFTELGDSLKNIINQNREVSSAVEINENNNVLLSLATQNALDKGIHVIIDDKCSLKQIDIDEMELYRIIKNIVNNAVKAMNGKGIIKIATYNFMDNIVIEISNNGPKIPDEQIDKIFEVGFTTKDNSDGGHGFGLSIVKDLVESHNGIICVKSTNETTMFKITFINKNKI